MAPLDFLQRNKKRMEAELAEAKRREEEQRRKNLDMEQQRQQARLDRERERKDHEAELQRVREREDRMARELAIRHQAERQEQERVDREERERARRDAKRRLTTPESLRRLRGLIRRRYELDASIWAERKARGPDRPFVVEKMEQADAVLDEIRMIVKTWENNDDKTWTDAEWELAQEIYARLMEPGKREWHSNPPWDD